MKQNQKTNETMWTTFLMIPLVAVMIGHTSMAQNHQPPEMDAKTKAAFEACASANSLPQPGSGQRPTKEQRDKMDACLAEKNVSLPRHPHHQHPDQGQDGNPDQAPPQRQSASDDSSTGAQ